MLLKVFLFCGQAAADVALGLVGIQDQSGGGGQGGVDLGEAFGDVFMYRRLGYSELPRRLAHRSFCVYDIICDLDSSFFDIIPHRRNPCIGFLQSMQG